MKIKENRIYKWATKKDYVFNQSPIDNILTAWSAILFVIIVACPFLLIAWLVERFY